MLAIALSAGREDVDVGENGSIIQSDNIGAIFYTTHTVGYLPPIEMSVGYGGLNFETERVDGSEILTGERKGSIYFGSVGVRRSISTRKEH